LALRLEAERKAKQIEQEEQKRLSAELAEIERKQNELKQSEDAAKKYFKGKQDMWQHRLKLRSANTAKDKEASKQHGKNLETKIKKIQGFLKKTKQFDKHCKNVEALITEMNKLKIAPYIDEIVKDLTNTTLTDKDDIDKLLHLASAINQRFEQKFSKPFREGILDAFRPSVDLTDAAARRKQLVHLMMMVEMQYLGLLKGGSTLVELIKHVVRTESRHRDRLKEKIKAMAASELESSGGGGDDDNNYKMEDTRNKSEISVLICEYDEVMVHTLELVLRFVKHANEECLGCVSEAHRKHYEALGRDMEAEDHAILKDKQQKQLRELITAYFDRVSRKYVELELKLRKQRKTNNVILVQRGNISDARQEITSKLEHVVQELQRNLDEFCQHLSFVCMPELLPMEDEDVMLMMDGKNVTLDDAKNASFFDDEVSRSFYENLPRLKDNIPGSLLQGDVIKHFEKNDLQASGEATTSASADSDGADIDDVDENEMPAYLINNEDILEDASMESFVDFDSGDPSSTGDAHNTGNTPQKDGAAASLASNISTMKQLVNALQCIGSRRDTEILAERFCFLNSKNNRKALALYLSQIKHHQSTRLPFYARFIAILNLCDINIGDRVCLAIEKEFYRLWHAHKKWLLDAKMTNLMYISELTKFCIFPFNALFRILEKLSKKFNNESIELLSFFMYQCGRYLYKNPLTHYRLNKILKYLKRRQIQTNLDPFLTQHIVNALYACKPPELSASIEQYAQKLTPWQQYVEQLLYCILNQDNKQSILRKLRKLPWSEKEDVQFMVERLFDISKINFEQIECIAAIIQGLNCYHAISTLIVDCVCEEVRIGLEEEDFTQEQRRLSYCKFLGDLYTYKAVNSQVIFDTLYLFVTYNIESVSVDTINFRICLCCMLLETCGRYLRKGKLKSRCDRFLLYFQQFIALNLPTPLDIEWWVKDVFQFIAPNMRRLDDLQLISEKIRAIENSSSAHKDALSVIDEDDGDDDEEEEEEDDDDEEDEDEDLDEEEEHEDDDDDDIDEDEEDDTADVDSYHRKKKLSLHDKKFIDEYEAMMEQFRAPTTRKTNINNLKHASLLAQGADEDTSHSQSQAERDITATGTDGDDDDNSDGDANEDGARDRDGDGEDDADSSSNEQEETVQFKLLSKKGVNSTKLKVGVLKIPKLVIESMKQKQRKESKSEDKVKSVTLQHLQHYENEDMSEDEADEQYSDGDENYAEYDMIDGQNNVISVASKSRRRHYPRGKAHSLSAKRKHKQSLKQLQHQKVEDAREKQKLQRDEKRKKQSLHTLDA